MLLIRKARKEDTEGLSALHKASIAQLCAKSYAADLVQGWLEIIQPNIYDAALRRLEFIVVEGTDGLLGFGMLDPKDAMVCALYVAPAHAAKGIGSRILETLERLALVAGEHRLSTFATLNAEGFYQRHGYVFVRKATHTLSNGTCLPCLKMDKELAD